MALRFGLIGCGRVAPRHAQSLVQLADTELVAVADVKPNRADHFSDKYGAKAHYGHLEILERNDGYKGFNQTGISEIIRETDPRNQIHSDLESSEGNVEQ